MKLQVHERLEERLLALWKDGPSGTRLLGWLIGMRYGVGGSEPSVQVLNAVTCKSSDCDEEADELSVLLPAGLEVVGAVAGNEQEAGAAAAKLAFALQAQGGEMASLSEAPACMVVASVPAEDCVNYKLWDAGTLHQLEVETLPANWMWQHVAPLRCQLPVTLPLYTPAEEGNPGKVESLRLQSSLAAIVRDLRSPSAAYVASSPATEAETAVLLQPFNEAAAAPSRASPAPSGGAPKGNNAKKPGGKGKGKGGKDGGAKAGVDEVKDANELVCGDLTSVQDVLTQEVPFPTSITVLQNQSAETGAQVTAPVVTYLPAKQPTLLAWASFTLDVLCLASRSMPLEEAVRTLVLPALCRQVAAVQRATSAADRAKLELSVFHFMPQGLPHPVSVMCSFEDQELKDQVERRRGLHERLGLPLDRPLLRAAQALTFKPEENVSQPKGGGVRLLDVHVGLGPSGVVGGSQSLVRGSYEYYHYMQDRMDDKGWGCAYRSLQTIVSWFRLQNYTTVPVPSHRKIQETLVELGDKEAAFVGSSQWIGAVELSYIIDQLLGVTCKILNISSGAEMPSKGRELARHFQTQGTPVMIGGGVLAYTLLGVDYNELTGDCAFLILDPHYTGGEDLKSVRSGGWCGWKRGGPDGIFVQNAFYNLLLPQRPNTV